MGKDYSLKLIGNTPLVSILIPNFNYATTIEACIESALSQTYKNIEIIVLDNCSSDNSFEVIKKYKKRGVRIYKNKENIGVLSHNKIITMANGKYVHILHSDDEIMPTFIEECITLMENNPNVGFTVAERVEIDEAGKEIAPYLPFYNVSCIIPGQSQKSVLTMASYFVPSQTVYKLDIIEQIGLYDISFFMDWWMLYGLSCLCDMGCINKPLVRYRVWPNNESGYMTKELLMPIVGFLTRQEIFKFARLEGDEKILKRYDQAMNKQADLTLKLSVQVIKMGLLDKGKRYLYLALSQSEEIVSSLLYKALNEYLSMENKLGYDIEEYLTSKGLWSKRNTSYDPPDGFILYDDTLGGIS